MVLEFCTSVRAGKEMTRRLLDFALDQTSNDKKLELIEVIRRLESFLLIHHGDFTSEPWHEFRQTNLVQYIQQLFGSGNIFSATLIFNRHVRGNN